MRKILLILGLVMLMPLTAFAGRTADTDGGDKSPLWDVSRDGDQAQRKMLNGESDGQPGLVPEGDADDHGSSGCKTDDDCERDN